MTWGVSQLLARWLNTLTIFPYQPETWIINSLVIQIATGSFFPKYIVKYNRVIRSVVLLQNWDTFYHWKRTERKVIHWENLFQTNSLRSHPHFLKATSDCWNMKLHVYVLRKRLLTKRGTHQNFHKIQIWFSKLALSINFTSFVQLSMMTWLRHWGCFRFEPACVYHTPPRPVLGSMGFCKAYETLIFW